MNPFKAPGPNDYQALFFQKYWALVGGSVCSLVLDVLKGARFPEGLNSTFLALIPKVDNPQQVTQFRPIGLCNVVYKIISKAIVQRLKCVLPSLISPCQTSFMPGCLIIDNVVIMQELLHTLRKKQGGKGYMGIKLDLEKAYDRLSWDLI